MILCNPYIFSSNTTSNTTTTTSSSSTNITVCSKKFLIATGSAPIVPNHIQDAAQKAKIPTYTYQSLLGPSTHQRNGSNDDNSGHNSIWHILDQQEDDNYAVMNNVTQTCRNDCSDERVIVIVGGGATACELCQSLARLGSGRLRIHLVAPTMLKGEDISLGNAAAQLLSREDGVTLHLAQRLDHILTDKTCVLSDGSTILPPVDALILCLGRTPSKSLATLALENAHVAWNETLGVLVKPSSLQSITSPHVYACGDCCSAVNQKPLTRTATHAAWTGYHAAANTRIPKFLRFGFQKATHPTVPRVIYTDPELVSVGLSLVDCIEKYKNGLDGFDRLSASELHTDRADMESLERYTDIGFVEIRCTKVDGRILGFTACGPSASELANEMSLCIQNGLTVRDIARSLHSYPSHGYLLYRVALALSFHSIWGQLEACGPVGYTFANLGRFFTKARHLPSTLSSPPKRRKRLSKWQLEGAQNHILVKELLVGKRKDNNISSNTSSTKEMRYLVSFLDANNDADLKEQILLSLNQQSSSSSENNNNKSNSRGFKSWLDRYPH